MKLGVNSLSIAVNSSDRDVNSQVFGVNLGHKFVNSTGR